MSSVVAPAETLSPDADTKELGAVHVVLDRVLVHERPSCGCHHKQEKRKDATVSPGQSIDFAG